jgi:hypothetical protein
MTSLLSGELRSQEQAPESYEEVLKEYETKRAEGVRGLVDAAKERLEAIKKDRMQAADLDAVNALVAVMGVVDKSPQTPGKLDALPADAKAVVEELAQRVNMGIARLNQLYVTRLDAVKTAQLKSGNLEAANLASTQITKLNEEIKTLAPAAAPDQATAAGPTRKFEEVLVDALIDGNSELHVTKEGLRWVHKGRFAKPGRWEEGKKHSTYINGNAWEPTWQLADNRAADVSDVFPLPTPAPKLLVELISTSPKRAGKNENKGNLAVQVKENHVVVGIPDPAGGGRWYRIRIVEKPD